jgi:hypothetical protein
LDSSQTQALVNGVSVTDWFIGTVAALIGAFFTVVGPIVADCVRPKVM